MKRSGARRAIYPCVSAQLLETPAIISPGEPQTLGIASPDIPTAKASPARAKGNPRRVSRAKTHSAAAVRANQANRMNPGKARDAAKRKSRKTIPVDRMVRGNPVKANRRRDNPTDNLVPVRGRASLTNNPTSSRTPRQHKGRVGSDRIRTTGTIVAEAETTTEEAIPVAPTYSEIWKTSISTAH